MHGCGMADRVVTEHRTLAQPNQTLIAHHGRASRRASSSDVTRPPGWPSVKVVSKGNVTPATDVARQHLGEAREPAVEFDHVGETGARRPKIR
jgi:hypothetical protein